MDVIRRKRIIGTKKWAKGGDKIEVEMSQIQCHEAKNNLNCKIINTVPYKQLHNNIDNELKILKAIGLFRWEDYLTDEKQEKQVEIQKEKRLTALNQRNAIQTQLENYKKAEIEYLMQGRALPIQLEELKNKASDEYLKADANYERAKLDLQNLKRKKTGKEAAKDIKARIKIFLDKDRLIEKKRADFNQFLKEIGVVVEVNIPKKKTRSRKYENEINFGVGIGMYEAETNKYIGLDQRADDAFVLGMDVKEVIKQQIAERNRPIKVGKSFMNSWE